MRIYCNTGDPRLDEMGERIVRAAAASVDTPAFSGRIVLSCRAEDGRQGDGLILLYRGEEKPACALANVRFLRCPYPIGALEGAVRSLLRAETPEGEGREALPVPLFDGRRVVLGELSVCLTEREAAVFGVLYERRGEPVSAETLCGRVWGETGETNLCRVYVCRLRRALTPVFGKGFLVHVRNGGYMMR